MLAAGHSGDLISPRINLTLATNIIPLSVIFFSNYWLYDKKTTLSVSFSSDDGVSWGVPAVYGIVITHTSMEKLETVNLPENSTQGVTDLTQCRIKFTFTGSFYYAMIDDISILKLALVNNSSTWWRIPGNLNEVQLLLLI